MRTGVLVVHGMGEQSEDHFGASFIAEMKRRLVTLGVRDGDVAFMRGFWADLLNTRERDLITQMARGGPLDYTRARRFVVNALGDAVAYRRGPAGGEDVYDDIHTRILHRLRQLRAEVGGTDAPLVVVAHSLGGVIMSDYIWDAQHPANGRTRGTSDFECMRTLAGIITFGSNIPLFTLALPKVVAVAPPRESANLSPAVRDAAHWHNYYDPDDVLGWPLKTLASPVALGPGEHAYADAVDADHAIDAGGVLTSWNPLSHNAYWRDEDFLGPAARQIADVARAARGAA